MTKRKKTGGRQKGSMNKDTKPLREMILGALDEVGGIEYLKKQAILNSAAFMTLVGKVLPTTLAGDKENPLFPKLEIILNSDDKSK